MFIAIALIAILSIVVSLFIETTSWWIKAFAPPNRIGLFVARTNIYLYGSRLFSLVFSSGLAAYVEAGHAKWTVASLISTGFLVAFISQILVVNRSKFGLATIEVLARVALLTERVHVDTETVLAPNFRLSLATGVGTYIFGLGIGLPLLLASLIPQHRLVISYSGQLINFGGSLVVIVFVDQTLFRSMDAGTIRDDVVAFTRGRYIGLFAVFVTFAFIALALRSVV